MSVFSGWDKIYLTVIFEFSLEQCSGSENVVTGPAASTSPGHLLEMQIIRPDSRPMNKKLWVGPSNQMLTKSKGDSNASKW